MCSGAAMGEPYGPEARDTLPPVAQPHVSVIVPARDAAATLGRTLAALAATEHAGPHEVVVVDDASADATAEVARAGGARVVASGGPLGPAGARNAGLAATDAPLVAFTDADCVPAPGWLPALVRALESADLVTGPVLPDPDARRGIFDRTLDLPGGSPRFETANLGVRREVAERVGGFEPFAPSPGAAPGLRPRPEQGHFGEDAVFGWRAVRSGARRAFAPEAVVFHAVFPRTRAAYVAEKLRLRFFPALVAELPELREEMPAGIFLSRRTAAFDAAVAGVLTAATRRSGWPLLLGIPYVRGHLRTWSPLTRGGLRDNAALVAGDAAGLAALVRGSIAARRPVL